VPKSYDASKPAPVVLALHPYGGATGPYFVDSWHLDELSEAKGFILVFPSGTMERSADRRYFWNATDSCCNFYGSDVDDVGYLDTVLDDVAARYAVDAKRIYAVGFSNGGFMGHRLACDRANRFAAIVSMGGATFKDVSRCAQSAPVALLEVHGTADDVVPFGGGPLPFVGSAAVPSVKETAGTTADKNRCKKTQSSAGGPVDVDAKVPGPETTRTRYDGCPAGAAVELWTVAGGEHVMRLAEGWPELLWGFLEKQRKP
jgi:polyhydroxybutyrate depolymerase